MKCIGIFGLILWISPWVVAQNTQDMPVIQAKLDSLLEAEHQQDQFHGTLVLGNKDQILYQKALGTANRVWDIPMEMDARFDIASINKSYFAALILIAVEEGKLKLEDKLVDRIRSFAYQGSFDPGITIHHMLSHTSGLPDYDAVPNAQRGSAEFIKFKRSKFSNAAYVDFISQLKPVGKPEEKFHYSNFAYHLLGIILEDIYQKHFSEILQEKICTPLQLKQTYAAVRNEEVHPKLVEAYSYQRDQQQWLRNNYIDLTLGRRIFASAPDLYRWGVAMYGNELLQPKSRQLMLQNHVKAIQPNISYGYGWVVFDGKKEYSMGSLSLNKRYIIHGGATEGFRSILVVVEEGELILAFLTNVGDKTRELQLTQKIIHLLNPYFHEKN